MMQDIKDMLKFGFIGIFGIIAFAMIAFSGSILDSVHYYIFGTTNEQIRRDIFEKSTSYNQGMVQELQNMRFEYMKTIDPEAKKALASIILHRSSAYNLNDRNVPNDLVLFINSLKQN